MPRLLLLASIGCLFVVAGVQFGSSQETRTRNGVEAKPSAKPASGSGGFMVGTPVRYKNLTIFPVLSKAELNSDRFITLDEGLRRTASKCSKWEPDRVLPTVAFPWVKSAATRGPFPKLQYNRGRMLHQQMCNQPLPLGTGNRAARLMTRTCRRSTKSIACWSSTGRASLCT